jgi:hypothetical protein
MGVLTRGLDIKAGAAKLKAERAARTEAELVVDRWNRRLATGRDMRWSPTIRAALVAGTPWLDVFCPGCGERVRHGASSNGADEGIPVGDDRQAHGVQARHRGGKDLAAIEGRKPVAESRQRRQIPKRHRGHRNAGSPRRLIDLVTQSPA